MAELAVLAQRHGEVPHGVDEGRGRHGLQHLHVLELLAGGDFRLAQGLPGFVRLLRQHGCLLLLAVLSRGVRLDVQRISVRGQSIGLVNGLGMLPGNLRIDGQHPVVPGHGTAHRQAVEPVQDLLRPRVEREVGPLFAELVVQPDRLLDHRPALFDDDEVIRGLRPTTGKRALVQVRLPNTAQIRVVRRQREHTGSQCENARAQKCHIPKQCRTARACRAAYPALAAVWKAYCWIATTAAPGSVRTTRPRTRSLSGTFDCSDTGQAMEASILMSGSSGSSVRNRIPELLMLVVLPAPAYRRLRLPVAR